MSTHAPRQTDRRRDSGYWVEAPRASDPIGFVLRDTYARDHGIPEDMMALLRQLSDKGPGSSNDTPIT